MNNLLIYFVHVSVCCFSFCYILFVIDLEKFILCPEYLVLCLVEGLKLFSPGLWLCLFIFLLFKFFYGNFSVFFISVFYLICFEIITLFFPFRIDVYFVLFRICCLTSWWRFFFPKFSSRNFIGLLLTYLLSNLNFSYTYMESSNLSFPV